MHILPMILQLAYFHAVLRFEDISNITVTHLFTGIIFSSLGWMHSSTLIIIFVFLQVLVTGTTVPAVVPCCGLYAGEITYCWLAVRPRQACTQVDSTLCLIASDTCVPRVVDQATWCLGGAAHPRIFASLVSRFSSLRPRPTCTGACGAKSTGMFLYHHQSRRKWNLLMWIQSWKFNNSLYWHLICSMYCQKWLSKMCDDKFRTVWLIYMSNVYLSVQYAVT